MMRTIGDGCVLFEVFLVRGWVVRVKVLSCLKVLAWKNAVFGSRSFDICEIVRNVI